MPNCGKPGTRSGRGDRLVAQSGMRLAGPVPKSIGALVAGFKSAATKQINMLRNHDMSGSPIWQRNYWETIIRNEESYAALAAYIITNPAKWASDQLCLG